ncbi:unnamed protein product [Miscanthus lutarioriparius]|uniref:BEACH domain-containing protein B n=1 Tax=Miscanthus lutarioriparius TaxID=422564 RepID=A0A811SCD4_9POAL|nr:unnamed protein product [Miscanthus lutarioriparius]
MNIVRGVADYLRKAPPPPPPAPGSDAAPTTSFPAGDFDDAPTPCVVFSGSLEEGALNVLWKNYENALDKDEKEKSLQIFVLQFVETFRDWGPHPIEQLVDQELGNNETIVGCSCGHPSEVILILIQEISLITSTFTQSGNSPVSPTIHHSGQQNNLGLSSQIFQVLECLEILTRSLHNCKVFSYYGGVQKIASLLKAAVAQLKNLNRLLAAEDQSSDEAVENARLMLNILVCIITIISNFMKLEITVGRIPHIADTTKHTPSSNHLAAVTSSSPDRTISDTLRHWQQKAIVLVMEARGVNWLVELLRVVQRLNLKEQCIDLTLHFITLCTLRSTVSGTRAQNHLRSIGGLEILLDGLGLPSSKFSVLRQSSISRNERAEILLLQIQYLQTLSEAVFGNVNNLKILCENGRVHKFANCICWPAFMIQKFHRQKDNTKASPTLDSVSGPIYCLDRTEWIDYSIKLSNALCSFVLPSEDIGHCSDEIAVSQIVLSIPLAYLEQSVRWIIRILMTVFLCIRACTKETELPNHIKIFSKTLQYYVIRMFKRVLISTPALLPAFREEGVWDLIFSGNFFYFGSSVEDTCFHTVTDIQNGDVNSNQISIHSESLYRTDVKILQAEAISFLEFAATLHENTYNTPECSALLDALEHCISDPLAVSTLLKSFRVILQLATEHTLASFESLDVITRVLKAACRQAQELRNFSNFLCSQFKNIEGRTEDALICTELALSLFMEYVTISIDGRILVLHNADCIECLFDLFHEQNIESMCWSKFLPYLGTIKICFAHDEGCFLHIISLLNGNFNKVTDEWLVLNVLQTLTLLLEGNDASKGAFRLVVGAGYQTLQSLVLDFYKWSPSGRLLDALLCMLVDCKFELDEKTTIKNEDAVVLLLNILQKEKDDTVIAIAELIQILGAHSICGKDIRKIFALLRCEKIGAKHKHMSLLLTSLSHMLKEKGPEAFFEFSGHDSGIEIKSPFLWPYNRGLSFSCWLRVENFPDSGMMGLFSFFTEDGKGCSAVLNRSALVYESIYQKHQCVLLPLKLPPKEWRFLSVTHTIGRAFSGGSQLRCYVDGELVSSEKCGYAKFNEAMTHCTIGTELMPVGDESISIGFEKTFAFTGQMGPVYVFSDALSSEQVKGIYFLGPSYMYSFHGDDCYRGILDARDGLSSKIIFGFNAQASEGRSLFSVSSALNSADRNTFEATIMRGTKLCSRHLPQDIIYCVGGVSVFFPLFTQFFDAASDIEKCCHTSVINDKLAAEVIELVATVLDGNVSNQQQMYLLSGLSILGFLLQSATPQLLTTKTLSALKYMFDILRKCGMSKVLLKDAISQIYLNPQIWVYASYEVQRDLYLFVIKYFETDGRLLPLLCGLPWVIDIVCRYYWEKADSRHVVASKPLLDPVTKRVIGERPKVVEIRKLRLLLLSLAEMSLKLKVSPDDIRALVAFFERSQDIACISDVLDMIIRALSQGAVFSSFVENVNYLGGCCIFINLLKREFEPVRLLGLQLLGKLLTGIPSEKEGTKLFTLPLRKSRPMSVNLTKEITAAPQLFLNTMSERLFKFPLSDNLCAALFSVLSGTSAQQEHSWNSWLETSTKLDVFKDYKSVSKGEPDDVKTDELSLGQLSSSDLLRDILDDIAGSLLQKSVEDNIFLLQPCCDNFLSPSISEESSHDNIWKEDIKSTVNDILNTESNGHCTRFSDVNKISDDWWNFFDKVWSIIRNLNGKGPSKIVPKDPNVEVASLGQRARGLVESMNVPAAEMAAVVSGGGGIGTALGIKMNRFAEKTTTSREEIIPRIFFHLVILYLCKAGLENASKCVLQFMSLLPILLISDDDQSKNKLHFLIWSLLTVRSQYGQLDDGARFHVFSHLILETIIYGKSMLVTNILGRDDSVDTNNNKETGFILSFIQKDRVLAAAANEVKHMKAVQADRLKQLQELRLKLNECSATEIQLVQAIEDEIHFTITAALSADDSRKTASQLSFREDQQIIRDKWIHISRALMDERGPWSANPFPNDVVTHWKLDKTEDRWRRRFKLKRNYKFDERLCQPSQSRNEITTSSADQPYISAKIPEKMKRFLLKGVRGITEDSSYEPFEDTNDASESSQSNPLESQNLNNAADTSDYHAAVHYKKEPSSTNGDNDYTKVLCSVRCVLVNPKRKLAGQLDITRTVMHFSFEFLVEGTGGSSVFSKFKDKKDSDCKNELGGVDRLDGCRDSMIKTNGVLMQNQSNKIKRHRRWNITKIKGVHWTRYLLQYTAMEIFFDDSSAPIFLNFSSQKDTKNAGSLLVSLRNEALFPKGSTKDKNNIISFVDRRVALEMAENARERWKRREISNFEYLVILNTLAGRSYNDLTQYPIFPWVLADYTSEKLDFNKSSTFRDLSKPVGALDENRFKVFEDRYLSFCDPDIPSFYYGSHYSSMGIVLHYMLRLEPFTALHLNFQGGKFDHADRLFQSIESAYINSLSSTSDVKELIPEFFYMPEFLENSNSYHLGVKQDGEPIGDVALPPWAKGSPEEFIHINREALESEYVSSNLHNWIDLIFGYKQRGQPAVEAANIFYYVTYEGAVDLENMDDMLHKSAIEDQIANFGQTPIQIFRMKHPRRGPPIPIAHPLYFAPQSITLTSSVCSTVSHMCAILFIGLLENTVVLMNEGLILSVKLWLTTQLQSGGNFTYSGPQEHLFEIGSDVISPRKIGTFLAENVKFGRQCLATMQNSCDNYLILCGNWENSFQIISLSDGRIMQSIRQHKDVVSCVAVSSDGNMVATGSYDTTVMIWHAFRGRPIDKKMRGANFELSEKEHVIVERPVHILCGHDDIITCLFVSAELDIVISGSKDGTCIFHTLREGRYVRSIQHPSGVGLSKLVASQHGRVVLYSENDLSLHMYSINGRHIASSATLGRLNCIELSCCGDFIVCAGELGQIVLRSMHSLGIVWRYDGTGKTITSLAVTPEECILAGTKNGRLLVFSIETPLLRRGSMQRNRIKPSTTG